MKFHFTSAVSELEWMITEYANKNVKLVLTLFQTSNSIPGMHDDTDLRVSALRLHYKE